MSKKLPIIVWIALMLSIPNAFAGELTSDEQVDTLASRALGLSNNVTLFYTNLSGANEVPPNNSTASGAGVFTLSADQTQLMYHIERTGLSSGETAKHLHKAAVGVNGPIIFALPTGTTVDGTLNLTPQHVSDLFAGLFYINIHTASFPGGEIRGQVVQGTPQTYSISGKVQDGNGNPLAGVTLTIDTGTSVTTDINGDYSFDELEARTYTLIPTKANYTFMPDSRGVTVPPTMTNQNFTGTPNKLPITRIYLPLAIRVLCDDYEPNDNRFSNPSGPLLAGQPIQARLCANDAEDNYYFLTQTSNQVQINLLLPASFVRATSLWVYAQNDPRQFHEICKQGEVLTSTYTMYCSIPSPGGYIIRIYTDGVADNVNPYLLQVVYN